MKSFDFLKAALSAALFVAAVSCGDKAVIDCTIEDAPDSYVTVNILDINTLRVLDTVRTSSDGNFRYKVEVAAGQPEFIHVVRNGVNVASLLVSSGDRLDVKADTLGNFEVEGSEDAVLYAGVEKDFAAFKSRMDSLDGRGQVREYVRYYRDRLAFVMAHPNSMASVPVLFQKVVDVNVFGQETDVFHFENTADSLEKLYPESRYVKALRKEASARRNFLDMNMRLRNASAISYPDIALPDLKGEVRRLSEIDAKVKLVYFWSPEVPLKNLSDLDILNSVYRDYHGRGLEIYQIGLYADKAAWAAIAKGQKSPWVNVCDTAAEYSRNAALYNVTSVPRMFFICDETLVQADIKNESDVRKFLNNYI